ncbi:MAG: hypothetical protein A3F13_07410 [Gammaproteobacteria bacterium RIFCSPHIGHO2_12_FULL_40_19]|nr:MAG: hypothetical protein A3F13_07410 [Gammaproteobacteria bacterium RIFCSPHIGHO2_12_FULL_40_19]
MAYYSLRFVFGLFRANYVQKLYRSWLKGGLRDDNKRDDNKIAKNCDKAESFADKQLIDVVR